MTDNRGRIKATAVVGGGAVTAAILALSGPAIQHYEGTRLAVYRDPVSILTSCTGHTGPELHMGQVFTSAECTKTLDNDQRAVVRRIAACTHGDMPLQSWAAFTSFAFNVGSGPYCRSFAPMIDKGDLAGACARLSRYTYAGKVQLPGLVKRRASERAMCEGRT